MTTLSTTNSPAAPRERDPLYRLLLRVARRADALARSSPTGGSARRDRETWRRAEAELLCGLEAVPFGARAAGEKWAAHP